MLIHSLVVKQIDQVTTKVKKVAQIEIVVDDEWLRQPC